MSITNDLSSHIELFGELDFKTGDKARTVYSPAAYMTDLLQMLDDFFLQELAEESTDAEVNLADLDKRRTDIKNLLLSAENTYDIIPYLDIVNDVLQKKMESENNIDVYQFLKTGTHPLNLPIDFENERLKKFLKFLNVSAVDLYRLFQRIPNPDILAIVSLGLSQSEMDFLLNDLGADEANIKPRYNLKPEDDLKDLAEVSHFMLQTGLKGKQIRELLFQQISKPTGNNIENSERDKASDFFLNAGLIGYITLDEKEDFFVLNTGEDLSTSPGKENFAIWLERVSRFVRLAQKTDLSFTDLDVILRTCCNNQLDSNSFQIIAIIKHIAQRLELPINQICSLFSAIDDLGMGDEDLPFDLFNKVFNGKYAYADKSILVVDPANVFIHNSFFETTGPDTDPVPFEILTCNGDVLADQNKTYRIRVSKSLGITRKDLEFIIQTYRDKGEDNSDFNSSLDDAVDHLGLSLLYRLSKLVEVLDISFKELFQLFDLIEKDATIRRFNHFNNLIPIEISQKNGYLILDRRDSSLNDSLGLIQTLIGLVDWMQTFDFSTEDLLFIQTGQYLTEKASKQAATQKISLLNNLYQQFRLHFLSPKTWKGEVFEKRASRVIYDTVIQKGSPIVSKKDFRIVHYLPKEVNSIAYQALINLGRVYPKDFIGLGLSEKMLTKLFDNLIIKGYLNEEGYILENQIVSKIDQFQPSTNFSAYQTQIFQIIYHLFLKEQSFLKEIGEPANDFNEFEIALFESDLKSLYLDINQTKELYQNLIFHGYIDEEGNVQTIPFFADPSNQSKFQVNVLFDKYIPQIYELINQKIYGFTKDPLYLKSAIFESLELPESEVQDLMENLHFNDYIDDKNLIMDKVQLLGLKVKDFNLSLQFYPHRHAILSAIHNYINQFKNRFYALKKESFAGIVDDLVANLCYAELTATYLEDGHIKADKKVIFETAEAANLFTLSSYFNPSQTNIIYKQIKEIQQNKVNYQLSIETLEKEGFDVEEAEMLFRKLIKMGVINEDGVLLFNKIDTFLNVNNVLTFHVSEFEDYTKEIFFLINNLARENKIGLLEIDSLLKAVAENQEKTLFDVLAEGFEISAPVLKVVCQYLFYRPENLVETIMLPIIKLVNRFNQIVESPKSFTFNSQLRRIGQFAKLVDKLKLEEGETEVIFGDQDLVEKFPEDLILPDGITSMDAILEGMDDKIYLFLDDKYWVYNAETHELEDENQELNSLVPIEELAGDAANGQKVDAAFVDPDNNIWIIIGAFYFVKKEGETDWELVEKEWGKVESNFENPEAIQASFTDNQGHGYLFSGDQYIRSSNSFTSIDEGYPKLIEGNWKAEFPSIKLPKSYYESIDAAFESPEGKTFIFKDQNFVCSDNYGYEIDIASFWGKVDNNFQNLRNLDAAINSNDQLFLFSEDQVTRYSNGIEQEGVVVDPNFPMEIKKLIPAIPHELAHGIDAGFKGTDGFFHLFQHQHYVKLNENFELADPNQPSGLIQDTWGVITNSIQSSNTINAAFAGLDGKVYIFSGDQYFRYSTKNYDRVDEGYPKLIAPDWEGLMIVDAAFILDGKTYLFGLDEEQNNVYVEYATNDYTEPVEGFPKAFEAENFWNLPVSLTATGFQNPDAIFNGSSGFTYLFSGNKFIYFDHINRWWSEPKLLDSEWDSIPFNSVDAAFTGKDNKTYLFSGNEFIRYTDINFNKIDDRFPQTINDYWGNVQNNIEKYKRIDAGLVVESHETEEQEDGTEVDITTIHTYLFSGNQFFRYAGNNYATVEQGYPKNIYTSLHKEPRFSSLKKPWKGKIDSAFSDQRSVYLTQENIVHIFSESTHKKYENLWDAAALPNTIFAEEGAIFVETANAWNHLHHPEADELVLAPTAIPPTLYDVPLDFQSGLNAVLIGADQHTYLFKGDDCFHTQLGKSYKTAEEWGMVNNRIAEENHVDTAFIGTDNKLYLFRGDQFVQYAFEEDSQIIPNFIDGLPKNIEEHWGGLTHVNIAFVRDGKTFLLEKPNYNGEFRLVCYSSDDYSKPDKGYPMLANFSWWNIPPLYMEEGFRRVDAVWEEGENIFFVQDKEFIQYNTEEDLWNYAKPLDRVWPLLPLEDDDFQSIRTAFSDASGKLYFFSQENFVIYDQNSISSIEPIEQRWAKIDNNITNTGIIDAAFVWQGATTFLFSGDQYFKYSSADYRYVDTGYPKNIVESLRKEPIFSNLPLEFNKEMEDQVEIGLSVVGITSNKGNIYLFLANNLHVISQEQNRKINLDDLGKVKNRIQETNTVDAAYVNDKEEIILFSGDQFYKYSGYDFDFVDESYPKPIHGSFEAEEGHNFNGNLFPQGIDAAIKKPDGSIYLFKGAQYLGTDEPTLIRNIIDFWGEAQNNFSTTTGENISVDGAFVSPNGKTYVFKGDQYFCYSHFKNEFVDEGFPKLIRDNWGNLPVQFENGIDAAFVFGGKTYFLKDIEPGGPTEYVRYSKSDYQKIDPIYPQLITDRWQDLGDFLIDDIRLSNQYIQLQEASEGPDYSLTKLLDHREGDKPEPYQILHDLFGWNIDQIKWVKRNNAFLKTPNPFEVDFNLETIEKMDQIFQLTEKMGSDPEDILQEVWNPVFSTNLNLQVAADNLYRYLAGINSDKDWEVLSSQIHDELNELKRDLWVPLAISLDPNIQRARALFEWLLIDVEMGSCATTSRIKEAISAVQLYFHRYFVNLELIDLRLGADDSQQETLNKRKELKERWKWMKNYRLWEANRKVFLYPENYIRPELRDTKTPPFITLEEDLLQANVDDEAVGKAYHKYLDEYTEVSRVTITGGYVYNDPHNGVNKKLILFGQTKTDPKRYYYRHSVFPKGQSESAIWEAWRELNIQINNDRVYPVFAFGRIFVFWTKLEEEAQASEDSTATASDEGEGETTISSDAVTHYKLKICFSFYNLNEEWIPAQEMKTDIVRTSEITDPKLFVENSDKLNENNLHENILVSCSFNSGGAAENFAFNLTPELYTRVADKPSFDDSAINIFRNIFHESELTGGIDDLNEEKIVFLNTIEKSSDGPWYSFDHKGGSFLLLPAIPSLGPDNAPKPIQGNVHGLPTFDQITAAFQAPDRKKYFFGSDNFVSSDNINSELDIRSIWGKVPNNIINTGIVDAAYQDGNKTILISGDEYLRFTNTLDIADHQMPKGLGEDGSDPMPNWDKIDAAFKGPDGLTYFFDNTEKIFVKSDNLNNKISTASTFGAAENPFIAGSSSSVVLTACFSIGDKTYLIGGNTIIRYTGAEYDLADVGIFLTNDLFLLLEELGCTNNQEAFRGRGVSAGFRNGNDLFLTSSGDNFLFSGTTISELTDNTGWFATFEFGGEVYRFVNDDVTISGTREERNLGRNINAALVGLDGNIYIFSAAEFITIPQNILASGFINTDFIVSTIRNWDDPAIISTKWGKIPSAIGQTGTVDAAFQDGDSTFLFSGDEYVRFTADQSGNIPGNADDGYPKTLSTNTEGFPLVSSLNAVFKDADSDKTIFFSGTTFFESDDITTAQNTANRWGLVRNNITNTGQVDAAYHQGNHLFLLSGNEYMRFTTDADWVPGGFMDVGYPKLVNLPAGISNIDAAYYASFEDVIFLFAGDQYFKMNPGTEPNALPGPTPIKGKWGNIDASMKDGFDAAIEVELDDPDNPSEVLRELYFFNNNEYVRYDLPVGLASSFKAQDLPPYPYEISEAKFDVIRLTSSTSYKLNEIVFSPGGIEDLLDLTSQQIDEIPKFRKYDPDGSPEPTEESDGILVKSDKVNLTPISSHLDFNSANGVYYWEIFFHGPHLIAQHFNTNQQFEEAKRWLEFIYDPTDADEYWKFLPFLAVDMEALIDSINGSLDTLKELGVDTSTLEGNTEDPDTQPKDLASIKKNLAAMTDLFLGSRPKQTSDDTIFNLFIDLTDTKNLLAALSVATLDEKDTAQALVEQQNLLEQIEIIEKLSDRYTILAETDGQKEAFLNDPFDPHAIASLRTLAYRKTIVMNYVDNLLDWGDMLFRQYSIESINEARMLYILAYDLLGEKPESLGRKILSDDHSYHDLQTADLGFEFLLFLENELVNADGSTNDAPDLLFSGTVHDSILTNPYFHIPDNELFFDYWDRVEDRLYKIRHCLNILGVKQPLPLFQPPIDPMAVVQAVSGGVGLGALAGGLSIVVPHYRFDFLTNRAQTLVSKLNQFGSELLSTLEKKDAEGLSLLQSVHEGNMLQEMIKVRQAQLEESQQTILYLEESKANALERIQHFDGLISDGMNAEEIAQRNIMIAASVAHYTSSLLKIGAMIASGVPDSMIGPFIMGVKIGGSNIGQMLSEGAGIAESLGEGLSVTGEALGMVAQHQRMVEDWDFQILVAESEEKQLGFQIAAAKKQEEVAKYELANLNKEIAQNEEIQDFMKEKFTNQQLYQWMIGKMSGLYYQSYQLAFDVAKSAERAFQFERAQKISDVNFINGTFWDSQRKGLLAGEALGLAIDRMEQAYIDTNLWLMEISKNISLLELDPLAFIQLKMKGACEFYLSEALFDYDFPGHYCRQIKTLSITFDIGEGTYVNATLTQLSNHTIIEADPKAVKYLISPKDLPPTSIRNNWRPNQQIALSHHDEYEKNNGLFELRFDTDRYLPFEGTGAVSRWRLELNGKKGAINPNELLDVTLNIKYTACQGGPVFADAVRGMLKPYLAPRFFDMTYDFANHWNDFLDEDGDELVLPFTRELFPNMGSSKILGIFSKFELKDGAQASFTLNNNEDWILKDGKFVDTAGLSISSKGSKLSLQLKGKKEQLRNLQFIFTYKATV